MKLKNTPGCCCNSTCYFDFSTNPGVPSGWKPKINTWETSGGFLKTVDDEVGTILFDDYTPFVDPPCTFCYSLGYHNYSFRGFDLSLTGVADAGSCPSCADNPLINHGDLFYHLEFEGESGDHCTWGYHSTITTACVTDANIDITIKAYNDGHAILLVDISGDAGITTGPTVIGGCSWTTTITDCDYNLTAWAFTPNNEVHSGQCDFSSAHVGVFPTIPLASVDVVPKDFRATVKFGTSFSLIYSYGDSEELFGIKITADDINHFYHHSGSDYYVDDYVSEIVSYGTGWGFQTPNISLVEGDSYNIEFCHLVDPDTGLPTTSQLRIDGQFQMDTSALFGGGYWGVVGIATDGSEFSNINLCTCTDNGCPPPVIVSTTVDGCTNQDITYDYLGDTLYADMGSDFGGIIPLSLTDYNDSFAPFGGCFNSVAHNALWRYCDNNWCVPEGDPDFPIGLYINLYRCDTNVYNTGLAVAGGTGCGWFLNIGLFGAFYVSAHAHLHTEDSWVLKLNTVYDFGGVSGGSMTTCRASVFPDTITIYKTATPDVDPSTNDCFTDQETGPQHPNCYSTIICPCGCSSDFYQTVNYPVALSAGQVFQGWDGLCYTVISVTPGDCSGGLGAMPTTLLDSCGDCSYCGCCDQIIDFIEVEIPQPTGGTCCLLGWPSTVSVFRLPDETCMGGETTIISGPSDEQICWDHMLIQWYFPPHDDCKLQIRVVAIAGVENGESLYECTLSVPDCTSGNAYTLTAVHTQPSSKGCIWPTTIQATIHYVSGCV